ncbi:MAG: hypothetical protein HRT80_03440 [Henriciella sp.]|nr:hypothetical protein [Henriciella sp.]
MNYIAGENEARAGSIDFRSTKSSQQKDVVHSSKREKWPLWWTVLGVTIFCAMVWGAIIQFLFL